MSAARAGAGSKKARSLLAARRALRQTATSSTGLWRSVRLHSLALFSSFLGRILPRHVSTLPNSGRYSTRGHAAAQAKSALRRCGLDAVPASKARGERAGHQENWRAGSRPESPETGGERSKGGETAPGRRTLSQPLLEPCSGPA